MSDELSKLNAPAKAKTQQDNTYKVGSAVIAPRVYFPCVFIPAADYRQPIARISFSDGSCVTRCVACQIAPRTCSLFKLFPDKFRYKSVAIDYDFQVPLAGPISVRPLCPFGTSRPVSSYLKQLFDDGVFTDGQIVSQCVNGEMVDFQVACAGTCIFNNSDFTLLQHQEQRRATADFSGFNRELVELAEVIRRRCDGEAATLSSCLLYGPPGHGKTTFFRRLQAAFADFYAQEINVQNFASQVENTRYEKAILFFDEIDQLETQQQIAFLQSLRTLGKKVFLIAATNRIESLDSRLLHAFGNALEVVQDEQAKLSYIYAIVDDACVAQQVLATCRQMSPADIVYLLDNSREDNGISLSLLAKQIQVYQPSVFNNLQLQKPEKVYGHAEAVSRIMSSVIERKYRVFLLVGPPGCGKNQIIKYFALQNIKIPVSSASEVVGPYVGQSEKQLHALFKQAMSATPSVLFFDEIDGLFADREAHTRRLWTTFQDILSEKSLTLILATNKPWILSEGLLRRAEIIYIGELSFADAESMLSEELGPFVKCDWSKPARMCYNCSGAAIRQRILLVKRALLYDETGSAKELDVEAYFYDMQCVDAAVVDRYRRFLAAYY